MQCTRREVPLQSMSGLLHTEDFEGPLSAFHDRLDGIVGIETQVEAINNSLGRLHPIIGNISELNCSGAANTKHLGIQDCSAVPRCFVHSVFSVNRYFNE